MNNVSKKLVVFSLMLVSASMHANPFSSIVEDGSKANFKDLGEFMEHGKALDGRSLNLSGYYLTEIIENLNKRCVPINLKNAILVGSYLFNADLTEANLDGANLNNAKIVCANLLKAKLNGANLEGADLNNTDLSYAELKNANLKDANLNEADLNRADLEGANLKDATIRNADFIGANLYRTKFTDVETNDLLLSQFYRWSCRVLRGLNVRK